MAIFTLISVSKMTLTNQELVAITGGAGITAALITSIVKAFNSIIDFGRMIGSSIRRSKTKNYC